MIRAAIFDLDDTLYMERDYFQSGFGAVADSLEARDLGTADELRQTLIAIHVDPGRDRVFDIAADRLGFPATWVPDLVTLFRNHRPAISPAPDTVPVLGRLRLRYKLGLVTDGWAAVQRRKIEALAIAPLLDAVVVADDDGPAHWKPNARPFLRCCELLDVTPDQAVFVGDNPERDILGADAVGMACIRIRRQGGYLRDNPGDPAITHAEIADLTELELVLATLDPPR